MRLLRGKAAQLDEFQAECFDLGEHAVKRGLVGQCAREHGVSVVRLGLEGWERGADRLAQVAADADLVSLRLGIAVRTGHLLTVHDAFDACPASARNDKLDDGPPIGAGFFVRACLRPG